MNAFAALCPFAGEVQYGYSRARVRWCFAERHTRVERNAVAAADGPESSLADRLVHLSEQSLESFEGAVVQALGERIGMFEEEACR